VPILDVLTALGLEHPNRAGKIPCVFHDEDTPSMHIYEERNGWHSYCCGIGGDVIDLVAAVHNARPHQAARWLLAFNPSQSDPIIPTPRAERTAETDLTDRVYRESVPPQMGSPMDTESLRFHRLLESRGGFNDAERKLLVDLFGLRISSGVGLWIPHWHVHDGQNRCVGVKTRPTSGDLSRKFSLVGSTFRRLYRPPRPKVSSRLLVCEGESDTWAVTLAVGARYGPDHVDVAGLPGGVSNLPVQLLEEIGAWERVVLLLDADPAGEAGTATIVAAVPHAVDRSGSIPGGRAAEAVAEGWCPEVPS